MMPAAWSPFSKDKRAKEPPRTRGRRRQRLAAAPGGPDAVLTDRDAAHAAETAMQDRTRPQAPAWERFGSQAASPARNQHDGGDAILRLADAARDHCGPVTGAAPRSTARPVPDYGTGPDYDIATMG